VSVHFANGKAKLLSSGSQLPGSAVTNAELFAHIEQHCGKKLAKKAARISRNFGINQRHLCRSNLTGFTPPDHSAPQLCVDAIQNALLEAGRNLVIDYLIGHTTTPETLVPPNIAWVADKLNHTAPYMELRQACTGFANALQIALPMLAQGGGLNTVGIVGSEVGSTYFNLSPEFVDLEQLINCLQMGDGAGAVLLGQDDGSNSDIISDAYIGHIGNGMQPGFYLSGGGSGNVYCKKSIPEFRHNAVDVKNNGASLFLKGIEAITQRGYSLDDFAYILPHQVNGYLDELFEQHLGVAKEKVIVDAGSLGNLGSAAIWVSFDRLRKSGRLKKGDKVLVLGAEATKYLYGGFVFHV
jgi:3-oxoacyl-[acyl-carrier-protein] synthase-3